MGRRTKGCPRDRSEQQQNAAPVGPLDAGVGSGARSPRELWRPGRARTSCTRCCRGAGGVRAGEGEPTPGPLGSWAPGRQGARTPRHVSGASTG